MTKEDVKMEIQDKADELLVLINSLRSRKDHPLPQDNAIVHMNIMGDRLLDHSAMRVEEAVMWANKFIEL